MRSDERGDGWKHDWASRRAEEGQDGLPDCNLISNSFKKNSVKPGKQQITARL